MKLFIVQLSPTSGHFISSWSKYSQHPVLKYLQSVLIPKCHRINFTPIQNQRQNYTFDIKADEKTESSGLNGSKYYQN
jgi:hypothetical protein